MDMPQPVPGHSKMEKLAGPWEGEENMHPSQWDPKGGVAIGRTKSRLALNRRPNSRFCRNRAVCRF